MSDQESSSPSGGPPPPGPPGAPGGPPPNIQQLGMVSHKMSLTTIFGHKHIIKNFIKKFDIFQLQKGCQLITLDQSAGEKAVCSP